MFDRPQVLRVTTLVLLVGLLCPFGLTALEMGDSLPEAALELPLVDLEGATSSLAAHGIESGLLLVFTSNTCPYATDWLDRFPRLAKAAQERDLPFLLVNSNARKRQAEDSPEAMAELVEEHAFDFPYLVDPESRLADALGATRTPEVFLFDGERRLVYHGALDDHSGPFEKVENHWTLEAMDQAFSGGVVETAETPPLGCAILRPRKRRPRPAKQEPVASTESGETDSLPQREEH